MQWPARARLVWAGLAQRAEALLLTAEALAGLARLEESSLRLAGLAEVLAGLALLAEALLLPAEALAGLPRLEESSPRLARLAKALAGLAGLAGLALLAEALLLLAEARLSPAPSPPQQVHPAHPAASVRGCQR
jgi:hypothetical protein